MSVGHRCSLLHPQQARVRCPVQLHLDKLDIRVPTLHLMRDIWKINDFMIERIWWVVFLYFQIEAPLRAFPASDSLPTWCSLSGCAFYHPGRVPSVQTCGRDTLCGTPWDTHCVGHGTLGISTPLLSPLVTTLTLSPSTYGGGPPIW